MITIDNILDMFLDDLDDLVGMLPVTCDAWYALLQTSTLQQLEKLRDSDGNGFVKPPQTATLSRDRP